MKKIIFLLLIIILIPLSIILYSRFIGTKGLIVKEYKITNNKLDDNYHGLKIIHLSDINYGTTIKEKELNKIVEKINFIKPDLIFFTGNMIPSEKEKLIKYLSKLDAKLGKFAISGNKDIPLEDFNYILKEANFINLDNDYKLIYNKSNNPIIISGIGYNGNDLNIKTEKFEKAIANEKPMYSILLMHEPDYIDNINLDNYNLVLCGHSLNGQINIPYIKNYLLPNNAKKYYDNYYNINNTDIFISSGLGTDKYKFRFLNKPSINFYRLTKK